MRFDQTAHFDCDDCWEVKLVNISAELESAMNSKYLLRREFKSSITLCDECDDTSGSQQIAEWWSYMR